jgi:apoptosis-inducing factor 3
LANTAKNIIVVGSSFAANEAVSNLAGLTKNNAKVSMICSENVPFEKILGPEIGKALLAQHEANGVKVHSGKNLDKISFDSDESGNVSKLALDNSEPVIDADLIIMATGSKLDSGLAANAGLRMEKDDGSIKTNPFMQTSDPDIFAAGDAVTFPSWHLGKTIRVDHWSASQDQGSHAAFNMLGKMSPYSSVPFFQTKSYGKTLTFAGFSEPWDSIHIIGDP